MSEQEREALAELIWTTSRNDESTISATGANHIADALLAAGWTRPGEDAITFKLADPGDWSDDWCCVCGSEDVAGRRGMYLLTDGSLGRVAWCSAPGCLEDLLRTNYLPIPERLRAALASPVREPGRSEGEPPTCPNHREVQHRDRKPPWCPDCGWNHGRPAVPARQIKVRADQVTDTEGSE